MEKAIKKQIIDLIHHEVIPAIGCTEPIAVALAVAKASELLGSEPEQIEVFLSANILKNAMGVGIPGTGMVGLPIAIALGAIIGKSAYGLEVLKEITPEALEKGKALIKKKVIKIALKQQVDKLYIEAVCHKAGDTATAIIAKEHTHFVYLAKNGNVITDTRDTHTTENDKQSEELLLTFNTIYQFATETPTDEISFILQTTDLNSKAASASLVGEYGHSVCHTISGELGKKYMGEIRPALQAKIGCKNVMQIPKLEKIVVSTGIGTSAERDAFTEAKKHLGAMTGQQPVITKARKNVSNFKLRVGMPVGVMVTLRGSRMYEFLDRFVHNALPRVRDFRGIPKNGFDGVGNYNLGISDVSVFTEVDADKLKYPLGVNVTIVTTAKDDESARELLKMMEVPFED